MASHILWQNAERSVTLVDVPRSIVEAQGFNNSAAYDLLSVEPRADPYPSTEPKSAATKAKLVGNTVDEALHAEYRELLIQALDDLHQHYRGSWCLPRPFVEDAAPRTKKRKIGNREGEISSDARLNNASKASCTTKIPPDHFLSSLPRAVPRSLNLHAELEGSPDSGDTDDAGEGEKTSTRFFSNDSGEAATLVMPWSNDQEANSFKLRIPPGASFYLGDCADSSDFRTTVREHAQQRDTPTSFDFILLDPPWPNRSVKRTHHTAGATYQTIRSVGDLGDMILNMRLETLMAASALVGVWITNKPAVRELVLGSAGLFECWGVEPVEEWLWLKTTTAGEPTSALDALWRKPYEVLLLGRKRRRESGRNTPKPSVTRRVIIAVPDLHSRKPCVKSLIEPMMTDSRNYSALEIFARHLVSGWCSWGDECTKFNCAGYWRAQESC